MPVKHEQLCSMCNTAMVSDLVPATSGYFPLSCLWLSCEQAAGAY
jgi:hypothetical protein